MIEFFLGKTGAGKSYLALRRIVEFLIEHPDGFVLTNLSINKGALNAYLKTEYPKLEPDVVGRVHLLDDTQCRQFYLYREPGNVLSETSKDDQKNLRFPDFESAARKSNQVLYVIDEAHIFFDSREWANVGPTLNFFASQHRKFRSDIIFITQFLDQVEKRLRNHATSFSECFNWGLRTMLVWKMPKMFRVAVTYKAPPCPSENSETYRINTALAACYDTTAGVGTKGGFKPEIKRQKGLPFWTLPAAGVALIVVLSYVPEAAIGAMLGTFDKVEKTAVNTVAQPPPAVVKEIGAPGLNNAYTQPTLHPERFVAPAPPPLRVVSYVVRGDKALVTLSDGRIVTESDPEFGGIDRRGIGVYVSGKRVPMVATYIPPPRARPEKKESPETAPEPPISDYVDERPIPTPDSAERSERAARPMQTRPQNQNSVAPRGGPRQGPPPGP